MTRSRPLCLMALMLASSASPANEPPPEPAVLRVRLAALSRHELEVRRVEAGALHLRPVDGAGEVVVPLAEVRELQLVVPAVYQHALQRVHQTRLEEARQLLAPWVPGLSPLLEAARGTVVPILSTHLDVLLRLRRWEEAQALVAPWRGRSAAQSLSPAVLQLARGLQQAGRPEQAAEVVGGLILSSSEEALRAAVEQLADELRRAQAWAAAQQVYTLLGAAPTDGPELRRWLLLVAMAIKRGDWPSAADDLAAVETAPDDDASGVLYRLLQAELAGRQGDHRAVLDGLGEAVVLDAGTSEWTPAMLTLLAASYRAEGQPRAAAAIEADLALLYPSPAPPPPSEVAQ